MVLGIDTRSGKTTLFSNKRKNENETGPRNTHGKMCKRVLDETIHTLKEV